MVPPVELPPTEVLEPSPSTVSPAVEPVLTRMIPFEPPFAVMLLNVSPFDPMVVFATFKAVPVVVAIVFCEPVTLTVPPLVADGPGPVAGQPRACGGPRPICGKHSAGVAAGQAIAFTDRRKTAGLVPEPAGVVCPRLV
jgi:hypothetical protein